MYPIGETLSYCANEIKTFPRAYLTAVAIVTRVNFVSNVYGYYSAGKAPTTHFLTLTC